MSVKLRRYMSVWMLLVAYCFSVGAAAYAVLSCHCMGQEKGEVHICCRGCDIHTECDSHSAGFKAVCCGVDHSKVSELTAIPFDSVHWATVSERLCLAHSTVHLLSSGLRAPPVFV